MGVINAKIILSSKEDLLSVLAEESACLYAVHECTDSAFSALLQAICYLRIEGRPTIIIVK